MDYDEIGVIEHVANNKFCIVNDYIITEDEYFEKYE